MADAKLRAAARRRWEELDWTSPIPEASLVIPEAHYMDLTALGLTSDQRLKLNRLFACFTCELFIHFEGYVIRRLEGPPHRAPSLSAAVTARFAVEERIHVEMFRRLLHKLRPDLYPAHADDPSRLCFLRWSAADDVALRLMPEGTFFLLAWLFEEITLFVPTALETRLDQCSALVIEVMRLHAREERPHVALDERALAGLTARGPRLGIALQTLLTLPTLAFVNARVHQGWAALIDHAAEELALTPTQRRLLADRSPSQSDRMGTESFTRRLAERDLAGASVLGWALRRELRRNAP